MIATIVRHLLIDGQACLKCHVEGTNGPSDVDAFNDALKVPAEAAPPLLTNRLHDHRMTRRSIFIGAAASLICAPAIVRAASLMPVRGLPLQFLNPLGEFHRRCFYHSLDHGLRTGRITANINGKMVSAAETRRMVAYARAQGWLPPG